MKSFTLILTTALLLVSNVFGQSVVPDVVRIDGSFRTFEYPFHVVHSGGFVYIYQLQGNDVWDNNVRVYITSEQEILDAANSETADATDLPRMVQLKPAYPNPFNPSTSIEFSLAETDHVQLTVHNMLGQQVKVIQDGLMQAGEHTVNFDGQGLASGVYTYTLQVGSYVETKKFSLVK